MSLSKRWGVGLLVCVLGCLTVGAEEPRTAKPPSDDDKALADRVHQLVRQLGDGSFQQREDATDALKRIGAPCLPELREAVKNGDTETRTRHQSLLEIVEREDKQRRIADFMADVDDQREHDLPGWKRFHDAVGGDRANKQFFVDMLEAEPDLLAAYVSDPKRAGELLESRMQALYPKSVEDDDTKPIPLASIATFLLVGSDPKVPVNDSLGPQMLVFVKRSPMPPKVNLDAEPNPCRRLLKLWLARGDSQVLARFALNQAVQFRLRDEAHDLACKELTGTSEKQRFPVMALLALAKFGSEKDIPTMETQLKNESVCASWKSRKNTVKVQVRDVALATMVKVTDQKFEDYGFLIANRNVVPIYSQFNMGFASDEKRDAALEKWRVWSAEHAAEKK